jgi:hypothetical protein
MINSQTLCALHTAGEQKKLQLKQKKKKLKLKQLTVRGK